MVVDGAHHLHVVIAASAREAIEAECNSKLPNETGGVLVGTADSGVVTVRAVVGPGPKAQHGRSSFIRDGEYAQQEMQALVTASGDAWDYMAEWHSHTAIAEPSPRDIQSMVAISASSGYGTPQPLLLICCRSGKRSWIHRAYHLRDSLLVEIPVRFEDVCQD